MENRFGFIREKLDIKILILFILKRLTAPIDFDKLSELTMCDDGISYFDFAECVDELVNTDHIYFDGNTYVITDKGERNGAVTESGIPYSVRLKAEKITAAFNAEVARNAMIVTGKEMKRGGGFTVSLSLSDGIDEILSMHLYAANEKQADEIERGFRKNAENIYNVIINNIFE